MGLDKSLGNTLTKSQRSEPANTLGGIEIDYYFMASRFAGSKTQISLCLWTVLVDCDGFVYVMKTNHLGHYEGWEEVIAERIRTHLFKIGLDHITVKRLVRDIEIKKDGHIIPNDDRCGGSKIGIDGSDDIYIRRSKFTYLK